jgi:hypothetical protein
MCCTPSVPQRVSLRKNSKHNSSGRNFSRWLFFKIWFNSYFFMFNFFDVATIIFTCFTANVFMLQWNFWFRSETTEVDFPYISICAPTYSRYCRCLFRCCNWAPDWKVPNGRPDTSNAHVENVDGHINNLPPSLTGFPDHYACVQRL